MKTNEEIIQIIRSIASDKGISANKALIESRAGPSLFTDMRRGQAPSIKRFALLAEYLGVSVDRLIGNNIEDISAYNAINVNNGSVAQGLNSKVIHTVNGGIPMSTEEIELFKIFKKLDAKKRHKLLSLAFTLEEET